MLVAEPVHLVVVGASGPLEAQPLLRVGKTIQRHILDCDYLPHANLLVDGYGPLGRSSSHRTEQPGIDISHQGRRQLLRYARAVPHPRAFRSAVRASSPSTWCTVMPGKAGSAAQWVT